MKLRKVISGGQTGADRAGLECAKALGCATGGTAPKGYRTEVGPDPSLKELGLVESASESYQPRTAKNVKDADVTLWFGNTESPGYYCTLNATKKHQKMMLDNPDEVTMRRVAEVYEVVNVAGNRKSKNPGVEQLVRDAFDAIRVPND